MFRTLEEERKSKNILVIRPQAGFQEKFLSTGADIAVGGGAAGGGKSYALTISPLRNICIPGFRSLTLRRESTQLFSGGGLWDVASQMYSAFGTSPRRTPKAVHIFPSGASVEFGHLNKEDSVRAFDGAQYCDINFDELQHFLESQFWYMLSRNRSTCSAVSKVRATCNPDPDSFLRKLIDWYIDEESGYPIEERSGVIRYFVRENEELDWYDTYEAAFEKHKTGILEGELYIKSFTFIRSTIDENPALLLNDPSYKANLASGKNYEKERLLKGNWNVRPAQGELFHKDVWGEPILIRHLPRMKHLARYYDRASSLVTEKNSDPDYTSSTLAGVGVDNNLYIIDVTNERLTPFQIESKIQESYYNDFNMFPYVSCQVWMQEDMGSAGAAERAYMTRSLQEKGINLLWDKKGAKNKLSYWNPLATALEESRKEELEHAGDASYRTVFIVADTPANRWNRSFINQLSLVTDGTQGGHDDMADSSSGAFKILAPRMQEQDSFAFAKQMTR